MKIAIGADHAGYELKEEIKKFLVSEGHYVIDVGPEDYDPSDDYPPYAASVAKLVSEGKVDRGIVMCDSGIGVDIVANKLPGVRSALVHNEELAIQTRQHNDTNVLSLGAMYVDSEKAKRIVHNWLETPFSNAERHARRIRQIEEIESRMLRRR
jgi:ribose 5-phosphate isomerase B